MANTKISALTAATTPLAGTEVLPIVQSGATVKVSVDNLTTGKAVSGTQFTASTGNFIVGTAGKGIDFSINAHAAGKTSELLNWYEEGTWTPAIVSLSGAITSYTSSGAYTRVGRLVTLTFDFTITNNGTGAGSINITGVPFNTTAAYKAVGVCSEIAVTGVMGQCYFNAVGTVNLTKYDYTYLGGTNYRIIGTITYPA